MPFDLLIKTARLLVGRRYTSTSLTDTQEALTSTIQIDSDEVWSQASLIPSSNLPFSSSSVPGATETSSVLKYWYKFPLTVANDVLPANSVWFFVNPTGSVNGTGSQLILSGQQTDFVSPKYSITSLANQSADYSNNGTPPGYNISLFTSADGVTFTPWTSSNYAFDYKTGVLQFSGSVVPSNRVYATAYQYIGQSVSDALSNMNLSSSLSSSYFSGSVITASNVLVQQTASIQTALVNTGSFIYFALNNTSSAPTSLTQSGIPGELRMDDNYVYLYTNNIWTRIPKARWN